MANEEFEPIRQIEVTDQMVVAGASLIEAGSPYGLIGDTAAALARDVFDVMMAARGVCVSVEEPDGHRR